MEAKYNKFQPYTKVLVKSRHNQHYVIGSDHGYNDDEIKFYHDM